MSMQMPDVDAELFDTGKGETGPDALWVGRCVHHWRLKSSSALMVYMPIIRIT